MQFEIFVPHNEFERLNCIELEKYLNNIFYC